MDLNLEIVGYDAQLDDLLRLPNDRAAVAILEAYRIALNQPAFVASLAAKLVLTRAMSGNGARTNGR